MTTGTSVGDTNDKHYLAYQNRGIAFSGQEKYEQALRDFDKAIELKPTHAMAYFNRATTLGALGRKEQAKADRAKAKKLGFAPNE